MKAMTDSTHIVIVGAGLSGSLLACMLGKRGCRVDVYERRPDPRARGFIGGRSINLALSTRGITALRQVGLDETVLAQSIPMYGRFMHDHSGFITGQRYSRNKDDAIRSVSRGGLNMVLLDAAQAIDGVDIHFGQRCEDVDPDTSSATFIDEDTLGEHRVEADIIIGADGAFSAVRNRLQKSDRFNYSQRYLEHGYKELTIPPGADGEFAIEPNALHIWPRGGFMMIALPNLDRSFTCTCFWPFEGDNSFASMQSPDDIAAFFQREFPDAVSHMPTLVEDFQTNPTSSLMTVRCNPWHIDGRVALLGDAAHAIVPFYGQGMNAAFEDCTVLTRLLDELSDDWPATLRAFSRQRKPDADAIADLALENFIEMRDRVASGAFLLRKKVDRTLHGLLPRWYTPLYNLVSFSSVPYAEARRRGERQDRIIGGVLFFAAAFIVIIILALIIWWLL